MSGPTMISRLLDAAELLIESGRRSGAFRRRAVSTAYYAVFHSLAKMCAETFLTKDRNEEYTRIYRALDHGPLKNAFSGGPLKSRKVFSEIGDVVLSLQSERHKADYLPPTVGVFTNKQTRQIVDQARAVIALIEGLDVNDRRTLATHLLFKNRIL